jgi:hypothetical protein
MFFSGDKVRLKKWVTEAHMQVLQMHMVNCTFTVVEQARLNDIYYGYCVRVREDSNLRLQWIIKECYLEPVT